MNCYHQSQIVWQGWMKPSGIDDRCSSSCLWFPNDDWPPVSSIDEAEAWCSSVKCGPNKLSSSLSNRMAGVSEATWLWSMFVSWLLREVPAGLLLTFVSGIDEETERIPTTLYLEVWFVVDGKPRRSKTLLAPGICSLNIINWDFCSCFVVLKGIWGSRHGSISIWSPIEILFEDILSLPVDSVKLIVANEGEWSWFIGKGLWTFTLILAAMVAGVAAILFEQIFLWLRVLRCPMQISPHRSQIECISWLFFLWLLNSWEDANLGFNFWK